MSIIEKAIADVKKITSDSNGFGVTMTITAPDSSSVQFVGTYSQHHMSFDTEGLMTSSKNAHCSVSESILTGLGYTVRNANNEVALLGHRINLTDSSGTARTYVVREQYPDETVGLIVLILGSYTG